MRETEWGETEEEAAKKRELVDGKKTVDGELLR